VEGSETSTLIADFVPGSDFTMSSVFKPEKNAIDEIASLPRTMTFPAYYVISKVDWDQTYHQNYTDVPVTGWTLEATTEERGGEGSVSGYVTALLDGDLSTYWHSAWKNGIDGVINPPLPHLITIDMQVQQDIISVELARRPNNKDTKTVVFSISSDKENWRELGALYFPNATAPNALILLLPDNVNGRYIRASVTESNNVPNASISEMMFTSKK
jgi:hypothetical protein